MQWWKRLSLSDARQETEGGFMPFRFTGENCAGNYETWFRDEFFKELKWQYKTERGYKLEEACVTMSVNIMGKDFGQRYMKLTHAEYRYRNNHAPTTHMDFDKELKEYLHDNDMTGKYIVFSKELTGSFNLIIQNDAP